MAYRILFTPFLISGIGSFGPGNLYVQKNNSWLKTVERKVLLEEKTAYSSHQCWYSGTRSPLIAGLTGHDQIYIRGHCMAGFDGIYDIDTRKNEDGTPLRTHQVPADLVAKLNDGNDSGCGRILAFSLSTEKVVRRLIKSGLQATFSGKIKCYNCHSGEDSEDGDPSFARRLKTELMAKGYTACKVYGYSGALSSQYEDHEQDYHKTSTGPDGTVRASQARMRMRR